MKKKNEFTLVFTKDNNFCPVNKKYGTSGNRVEIARTALWVLNNALASIEDSYKEGAPRRIEMEQLYANLVIQLQSQLTKRECEELNIK